MSSAASSASRSRRTVGRLQPHVVVEDEQQVAPRRGRARVHRGPVAPHGKRQEPDAFGSAGEAGAVVDDHDLPGVAAGLQRGADGRQVAREARFRAPGRHHGADHGSFRRSRPPAPSRRRRACRPARPGQGGDGRSSAATRASRQVMREHAPAPPWPSPARPPAPAPRRGRCPPAPAARSRRPRAPRPRARSSSSAPAAAPPPRRSARPSRLHAAATLAARSRMVNVGLSSGASGAAVPTGPTSHANDEDPPRHSVLRAGLGVRRHGALLGRALPGARPAWAPGDGGDRSARAGLAARREPRRGARPRFPGPVPEVARSFPGPGDCAISCAAELPSVDVVHLHGHRSGLAVAAARALTAPDRPWVLTTHGTVPHHGQFPREGALRPPPGRPHRAARGRAPGRQRERSARASPVRRA